MDTPRNDYGRALSVDAEAIGRPGQRRFRFMARSDGGQNACVWMEKTQLAGIGAWFGETCERLDKEQPNGQPDVEPMPFGEIFDLDFRASQVGLGYVEDEDLFAVQAFDVEDLNSDVPAFRVFLTRGQARVTARRIETVVSAGRPICPLCEMPMEPEGHVCPRSNGHHPAVSGV